MVKESSKDTCLAIGDGANDVSMIQAAHIGIRKFLENSENILIIF